MKKIKLLLAAAIVLMALGANAQWNTNGDHIYNTNSGNIGIGTNSPASALDVSKFMPESSVIIHNTGDIGGAAFQMIDDMSSSHWKFKSFYVNGGGFKIRDQANLKDVIVVENNARSNALFFSSNGNVGIGTTSPASDLAVNGKITCKEVEITLDGWPDYVFENDYNLMSLYDLEKFITKNKHLPGIPWEDDIVQNGMSVDETNKMLMEKVEELTLHVIELQKQIDNLKEKK